MPELVDTFPVEVETPPVEVVELEVIPPVVVVLVRPPVELEVLPPEVEEDEPPPEVEVEVDPPEVVVETTTLPPPPLPPPKKPPKNPPPKPNPPEPPITVTSLPPPCGVGIGGSGGNGIGIIASCCGAGSAQATDLVTTRRICFIRGAAGAVRAILRFIALGFALACLTYWTWAAGASATCTAPPPTTAPPAAIADSFTRAIRSDISSALFASGQGGSSAIRPPKCPYRQRNADEWFRDNRVNPVSDKSRAGI